MATLNFTFFSKMLRRMVPFKAILPFDSIRPAPPEPPYKTLYFLPGYSSSAELIADTLPISTLVGQTGLAIILPDGENSFYVDQPDEWANHGKYVAEELVEVTRKILPLSTRREDTFIGGISMGGFGAMQLGLRYADTFSKIAVLSPAVHTYEMGDAGLFPFALLDRIFGSRENYLEKYDPYNLILRAKENGTPIPELFMRCGTEDTVTYAVDHKLAEQLAEAGIPLDYAESPGEHSTDYFARVLPEAVEFVLK